MSLFKVTFYETLTLLPLQENPIVHIKHDFFLEQHFNMIQLFYSLHFWNTNSLEY